MRKEISAYTLGYLWQNQAVCIVQNWPMVQILTGELTGSNRITKRENIILPGDTVRAGSSCETVYAIGIDKHGTAFFVNDDGDYIAEPVIEPYSGTLESILAEIIDGLDSRELIRRLGNTDLYHRVQEIRKRARAWREANGRTEGTE